MEFRLSYHELSPFPVLICPPLRHSQKKFNTKSALSPYPELHAKAYNATWLVVFAAHWCLLPRFHHKARVVAAWLSDFTLEVHGKTPDDLDLQILSKCMQLGWLYSRFSISKIFHDHLNLRYALGEWFNTSERNPRILTVEVAERMVVLSDKCLSNYLKLSQKAVANGQFLFPVRPKIHVSW